MIKSIKLTVFLVSLVCVLVLSACGLEQLTYLDPPVAVITESAAKRFVFRKTIDNSELQFRGFEIYYKFYPMDPTVTIENNIDKQENLSSSAFNRIASNDDNIDIPLIEIPFSEREGTEFDITISFSNLLNPTITATSVLSPIEHLCRGGAYDENIGYYKSFLKLDFDISDDDMWSTDVLYSIQNFETVRLAIYVLSCGEKDFKYIYSKATYLDYIELTYY